MKKPTDTEKIQLIAVLRVLDLSQDGVASMLHLAKKTVVNTEEWIKKEDLQAVWDILDDDVLKATVGRDLPSLGEVDHSILVRASQVDRAAILMHYGRKVPEEKPDEELRQHKDDLAVAAKDVLKILSIFEGRIDLDENIEIGEVILVENDTETAGVLEEQIVIGLFTHIKNDIAELAPLSCWQDLTPKYITFGLRNKISMKAVRRAFSGKCNVCEVRMRK